MDFSTLFDEKILFGEDAKPGHYTSQLQIQETCRGTMKVCTNTGAFLRSSWSLRKLTNSQHYLKPSASWTYSWELPTHWNLSWANGIQSTPSHPYFFEVNFILSSHQRWDIWSVSFPSRSSTQLLFLFPVPPVKPFFNYVSVIYDTLHTAHVFLLLPLFLVRVCRTYEMPFRVCSVNCTCKRNPTNCRVTGTLPLLGGRERTQPTEMME